MTDRAKLVEQLRECAKHTFPDRAKVMLEAANLIERLPAAAQTAEDASLRADAERWRWLRKHTSFNILNNVFCQDNWESEGTQGDVNTRRAELDSRIDAARTK